jgi:hypothetical protein
MRKQQEYKDRKKGLMAQRYIGKKETERGRMGEGETARPQDCRTARQNMS